MSTLVSTGQITIVDNNDAKPITAFITNGTQSLQQIYTKNDTSIQYTPDRTVTNLVLLAKAYIGGSGSSAPIETLLSNPKWSYDLNTPITTGGGITVVATIGSAPSFTVAVNSVVSTVTPNKVVYFEGDYTDPVTGLVSHVIAQTTLSLVQTGSNAVYVQFSGINFIEQATGVSKKQVEIKADLMRSSGVDTDNLTYKWFALPSGAQIDSSFPGVATKFGFRNTAQANADNLTAPTSAMLNQLIPTTGTGNDAKAIVIDESAIQSLGFFRVDITDSGESKTYSGYFTIQDTTDPYTVTLISTSGEKLQNGIGTTDIYPIVYYGATKVTDLTGWTFNWYFWSQGAAGISGYRTAFIDYTRMSQASGGRSLGVTPNTAGSSAAITYGGTPIAFSAGDIIKVTLFNGGVRFFEVASSSANTVTIRSTATTNTYLNNTVTNAVPTLNEFAGGILYACVASGIKTTTGTNNNDFSAKITVSGDEIDVKGNIVCEANRP